jgi:hypothetical protein
MPDRKGRSKQTPAIFTLAGGVVSALASIAVKGTGSGLGIVLIVVGAILIVFSAALWYQVYSDRRVRDGASHPPPVPRLSTKPKVDLHPDRLWGSLSPSQRETLSLGLRGAVTDVASVVGMDAQLVRSNMFSLIPGTNRLAMVKDATCHMERPEELTIQMDFGKGSTGRAFANGEVVRSIWKEGWGASDIGEDDQMAKVHPDLRWILSVPILPSDDPKPVLVLSVDGLRKTPSLERLATALSHLPRFGEGITRTLGV